MLVAFRPAGDVLPCLINYFGPELGRLMPGPGDRGGGGGEAGGQVKNTADTHNSSFFFIGSDNKIEVAATATVCSRLKKVAIHVLSFQFRPIRAIKY